MQSAKKIGKTVRIYQAMKLPDLLLETADVQVVDTLIRRDYYQTMSYN